MLADISGSEHDVITDTDINPTIIRNCRIVPINENEQTGRITVAFDFVDLEQIEKLRFLTNVDCLAVYASPNHIDSLIENHT